MGLKDTCILHGGQEMGGPLRDGVT